MGVHKHGVAVGGEGGGVGSSIVDAEHGHAVLDLAAVLSGILHTIVIAVGPQLLSHELIGVVATIFSREQVVLVAALLKAEHTALVSDIAASRRLDHVPVSLGQLIDLDDLLGAVKEHDLGGHVAIGLVSALDIQVVLRGDRGVLHGHHGAVGVQIDGHVVAGLGILRAALFQVNQTTGDTAVVGAGVGVVVVVGGAGHSHAVQALHGVHGALHGLSLGHGLDGALGNANHHDVVLGILLVRVELAAHAAVGLGLEVDGDGVVVIILLHLGHLGQVGVDDGHVHGLLQSVHEHLGQNAVTGALPALGVVPVQIVAAANAGIVHSLAVHPDIPAVVVHGGGVGGAVQVLLGDLDGPGGGGVVHIGADLIVLIAPHVGGTAEGVGVAGHTQVALVQLLAQLHGVLAVVVLPRLNAGIHLIGRQHLGVAGLAGGNGEALTADRNLALAVVLHHGGGQGVQGNLGHVVAGHGLGGSSVDAVEQLDLAGLAQGGQLPVVLKVAGILEVAQGLHHHQGGLGGGHALAAAVGGGAGTGGDAVDVAGGHIGLRPAGHVGKGRGAGVVGHTVVHQVGHHHGHLVAGDQLIRIEVAVVVADHHADGLEHFNGFLILLRSHVRVARSAGAHHHQAGDHGRGETQAESALQVSHWNSSL